MKNNKFCVSKSLVYLVSLLVVLVGVGVMVSLLKNENFTYKPKASSTPPTCPKYNTETKREGKDLNRQSLKRFVAKIEQQRRNSVNYNVCYGFTGQYTRYYNEPTRYPLAGIKVYYDSNQSNSQYNGCFLERIPCNIDSLNNSTQDQSTCPNTYVRLPDASKKAIIIDDGVGFLNQVGICGQLTGYKKTYYYADVNSNQYKKSERCITKAVSDNFCRKQNLRTTPGMTITMSSDNRGRNTTLCPQVKVWLSVLNDPDAEPRNYEKLPSRTMPNRDSCMKLTGDFVIGSDNKIRCIRQYSTGCINLGVETFIFYYPQSDISQCVQKSFEGSGINKEEAFEAALADCQVNYNDCYLTRQDCDNSL